MTKDAIINEADELHRTAKNMLIDVCFEVLVIAMLRLIVIAILHKNQP